VREYQEQITHLILKRDRDIVDQQAISLHNHLQGEDIAE
jgi:hypothetical protein